VRNSRKSLGLTLLEVLVTMALLAMAFAMVATLVRNFSSVSAHLDGKEGTQQGSLLLLGVAAELEEAFEITSPASGTVAPVTEIQLKKYASTPQRLATATTPDTWSPGYVISVRYYQSGEDLLRETTFPDNEKRVSRMSRRLSGFSATRINDQVIEVRATFRESKKLETVAASAFRWRDE
jgi:Prokaryotic N-terminal methylation motif